MQSFYMQQAGTNTIPEATDHGCHGRSTAAKKTAKNTMWPPVTITWKTTAAMDTH